MARMSQENVELFKLGKKRCSKCFEVKELSSYFIRKSKRDIQYYAHCKACNSKIFKAWLSRGKNARNTRLKVRLRTLERKNKWQQELFDNLGDHCSCCGESNKEFLTVDHINEDGWKFRNGSGRRLTGIQLWSTLKAEGYPKDKYRILCYNCNCGRHRRLDGICPHKATGAPEFISKGRRGRPRIDADTDPLKELKMAVIQSPFKDRVVPATTKKVGQDIQKVGPADLTIGVTLPGSTAQGMVTNLVKGK